MPNTPHEDRIERLLLCSDVPNTRNAGVHLRHYVDFDLGVVTEAGLFGALAPSLLRRRVLVEHHSTPPDSDTVLRELGKALFRLQLPEARRSLIHEPDPTVTPVLLFLCRGGIGACQELGILPHDVHPGWWHVSLPMLTIHVLDASRLRPGTGWTLLRFALAPTNTSAAALTAELLDDPQVPTLIQDRILEVVMNQQLEFFEGERLSALERFGMKMLPQLRAQVRAELEVEVRAKVEDELRAKVEDELRAKVEDELRAEVEGEARDAIVAIGVALGLRADDLRSLTSIDELKDRIASSLAGR